MATSIEYRDVSVGPILEGVTLRIASGESVAFIGRSGAGKTTALRLINALVRPTRGDVLVDERSIATHDAIALRRRIGYIIQGVGLFPHKTVYDNVATVPRLLGWEEGRIERAARSLLDSLEIPFDRYARRFPRTLSGGEQQRVGIARALVFDPDVLLCDEPFGALDPIVRREQQQALIRLRQGRSTTIVFVTHDLSEALTVADRLVLFDAGRVVADLSAREFVTAREPLVERFVECARLPAGLG